MKYIFLPIFLLNILFIYSDPIIQCPHCERQINLNLQFKYFLGPDINIEKGKYYAEWRCRKCGYECIKENPPYNCPICGYNTYEHLHD